ncbi:hypothetical protein KIPB_016220, partial [Kipferlia bialata]
VSQSIDRAIIKLSAKMSQFTTGDPASVQFFPNFQFFPQFLYHFRRSTFLQVFGHSPDETSVQRHYLLRSLVTPVLTMMQPLLLSYSAMSPDAESVFLDSASCGADRVLVLDTYFR